MFESTSCADSPSLPSIYLKPVSPLVPFISDLHLSLIVPLATYWTLGLLFHWFDVCGHFQRYRIHSPLEIDKKNRVSRGECLRGVLLNQTLQTLLGIIAGWTGDGDFYGREEYSIAVWASRVRQFQRHFPTLFAVFAIHSEALAKSISTSRPNVADILTSCPSTLAFAPWELVFAQIIYHVVIPFFQFALAVLISDSWQYFGHRWMHSNKLMYRHIHSRHHHLSVPYAYGSLYTHPLEGLLQDTLGVAIAFGFTGMTIRQGMWFYFGSTIKDVYDHCGYVLPWIPLRCDANYHDLHHQSWGMRSNFSVYTSFWDRVFGTLWTDGDAARKNYERGFRAAKQDNVCDKNNKER